MSSISSQPQRTVSMGREQYIRLILDSVDDQDSESTGENRSMLAFFDSLIQRESLGDLDDAMDDSSEDLDSDPAITAGRPRAVNFDRWSDVESSEAEEGEVAKWRTQFQDILAATDRDRNVRDDGSSSGEDLPHHPANGVVSRLRRKMKYREE